jgi:hypothetical protein
MPDSACTSAIPAGALLAHAWHNPGFKMQECACCCWLLLLVRHGWPPAASVPVRAQWRRRRRNAPPPHPMAGNGRRNGQLSMATCANSYRYCWSLLPSQEYFSAPFAWRLSAPLGQPAHHTVPCRVPSASLCSETAGRCRATLPAKLPRRALWICGLTCGA